MRILLAYKSNPEGASDAYTSLLPIGLGYLNAVIAAAGGDCSLANFSRWDWKAVSSYLAEYRPGILGISQFTHNRFEALRLAAVAKENDPSCFVVLGGPHASCRYRELLHSSTCVDAVVLGEGEEAFRALVTTIRDGGADDMVCIPGLALRKGDDIIVTGDSHLISDLDALPVPAAFINRAAGVEIGRQLEFITTSRGCPAACRFCSSPTFWGRNVRFRSPRSIIDEIRFIRDSYGLIYFSFRDDTFTADRKRVIELCRLMIQNKLHIMWNCQSRVNSIDDEMLLWMKRAGCECIQLGIESGSPRVLTALGKGVDPAKVPAVAHAIRRVGINLSIYLITGVPGEDDDDVAATVRLVHAIRPHDGQVSPLVYYPGTSLYTEGVAGGKVSADLFEQNRSPVLAVRSDRFADKSTRFLMKTLVQEGLKSRFTRTDFLQQKGDVGYCHATNILAGECYESRGEWDRAEQEYREIIGREPANPWGWLALGELKGELGDFSEAEAAFREVIRIVPTHAPGHAALGDLARLSGNRKQAARHYEQALQLDPANAAALEGARVLGGRQKK